MNKWRIGKYRKSFDDFQLDPDVMQLTLRKNRFEMTRVALNLHICLIASACGKELSVFGAPSVDRDRHF